MSITTMRPTDPVAKALGARIGWMRFLYTPLQRLRSTQLRKGSLYSNLRLFVPVLALAIVWFRFERWGPATRLDLILGESESIRHLLMAFSLIILWNLWLSLVPFEKHSVRKDILEELSRLSTATLGCGVLLFVWGVAGRSFVHGLELASLITFTLAAFSMSLLGLFILGAAVSPQWLPKRGAIIVGTAGARLR